MPFAAVGAAISRRTAALGFKPSRTKIGAERLPFCAEKEGFEQGLRAKTIVTQGGLAALIHPRTLCAPPPEPVFLYSKASHSDTISIPFLMASS